MFIIAKTCKTYIQSLSVVGKCLLLTTVLGVFLLFFISYSVSKPIKNTITASTLQPEKQTITLLFVGDLMQHQAQIDAARSKNTYNYDSYFKLVSNEIKKADLAIGNLEVTLGGKPYKGYPAFSSPDEFLYAIKEAGFDILTTANNHCLDRGSKGGVRTLQMLDSLNIMHLGTYCDSASRHEHHPLIVNIKNFKLAFIAYTYATNGIKATPPFQVNYIDTTQIAAELHEARQHHPDAIIALMHWGEEYQSLPSATQKKLADRLFAQGVTHIIGSHPHVVQPLEVRNDTLTKQKHLLVYSLGNYVSNMSEPRTDGGIMVKMELEKDSLCRMNHCAYSLVWTLRPRFNEEKTFSIIPVSQIDSLPEQARYKFLKFIQTTRALFEKHNQHISEYQF